MSTLRHGMVGRLISLGVPKEKVEEVIELIKKGKTLEAGKLADKLISEFEKYKIKPDECNTIAQRNGPYERP